MEDEFSIAFDLDEIIKERERKEKDALARKKNSTPKTASNKGETVNKRQKGKNNNQYGVEHFTFRQEKKKIILELHFEEDLPTTLNAPQIFEIVQNYFKQK